MLLIGLLRVGRPARVINAPHPSPFLFLPLFPLPRSISLFFFSLYFSLPLTFFSYLPPLYLSLSFSPSFFLSFPFHFITCSSEFYLIYSSCIPYSMFFEHCRTWKKKHRGQMKLIMRVKKGVTKKKNRILPSPYVTCDRYFFFFFTWDSVR